MEMWTIATVIAAVLVLMALTLWAVKRSARNASSGRDDRYTPERILTPEQAHMLDYLQDTFPGQVVLPNITLTGMLSVRRAVNRTRAQQRLNEQKVDFIVCGEDGRPSFAFDIEQHHLSDAKAKAHKVKMKNRILKSAGVRFVFLKNGIHRMPSPADFRAQLNLAELPKPPPKVDKRDSAMQQLESQFSGFDQQHSSNNGFRESEVMGMSGLMDLPRQLGGGRPRNKVGNGSFGESRQPGESGFDGSSYDVRGG
ncbi:DUF2726 domain-containing protein [Hydrogenophaga palleronii]|uniref:DUF2726 domain-containing protein n=1 Tax=Hydrogenophaga palleronii TaxID=65655 RepID=UPI000826775E|nr:DUF2726 domain-containing protein [Hydrogenophaga palleronii]